MAKFNRIIAVPLLVLLVCSGSVFGKTKSKFLLEGPIPSGYYQNNDLAKEGTTVLTNTGGHLVVVGGDPQVLEGLKARGYELANGEHYYTLTDQLDHVQELDGHGRVYNDVVIPTRDKHGQPVYVLLDAKNFLLAIGNCGNAARRETPVIPPEEAEETPPATELGPPAEAPPETGTRQRTTKTTATAKATASATILTPDTKQEEKKGHRIWPWLVVGGAIVATVIIAKSHGGGHHDQPVVNTVCCPTCTHGRIPVKHDNPPRQPGNHPHPIPPQIPPMQGGSSGSALSSGRGNAVFP